MSRAAGPSSRQRDRHREAGFVIVAVLWILAALAALVSVYSRHVIETSIGSKLGETRLEAEAAIKAGIELAAHRLIAPAEKTVPRFDSFTRKVGKARVEVELRSEGARVDLNLAKKPLLQGLFAVLGADSDAAAFYADRIIGWRSTPDTRGGREELEYYRGAEAASLPRQGDFQNVAELRLVLGLPPQLVQQMLDYVTVYNGRAEIDPMLADPAVLSALPGMTPLTVEEVLKVREEGDPRRVIELLGEARSSASADQRKATRLKVRVGFDSGRRVNAEVVILLMDGGFDPYRILHWSDDFDAPVG